jgi:hypothetical protein
MNSTRQMRTTSSRGRRCIKIQVGPIALGHNRAASDIDSLNNRAPTRRYLRALIENVTDRPAVHNWTI